MLTPCPLGKAVAAAKYHFHKALNPGYGTSDDEAALGKAAAMMQRVGMCPMLSLPCCPSLFTQPGINEWPFKGALAMFMEASSVPQSMTSAPQPC